MHAFTYFVLSLLGTSSALPAFLAESKRSLIDLSPDVDLGLDLKNDNSCLGIGASVCDPITVNSKTNSTTVNESPSTSTGSSKAKTETNDSSDDSGDDSLLNVSPDLGLDLGLSNDNSCLGIGISACDPITVGSDVTKTVTNTLTNTDEDSTSDKTTEPSTYPTASTESSTTNTKSTSSGSGSGGGLLNLSPTISPDVTLNNDNSCQGIGISACDPITVNSTTTQNTQNAS